ncbi:MAG: response regulator transcription factor [Thermoleophilia bacterium]|nr:response regulator transcription factor [Thermoleophilia bacterium]
MNASDQARAVRILVVDDDDNVRRLVSAYLEREGYYVIQAADGAAALRAVEVSAPDLVVLDLMLPGIGGLQVARRISAARELPILMLTARGDEDDVLRGFEAGADDYLVKPFSPRVLVARVRAILRRVGLEGEEREGAVQQGGLWLDPRTREVTVDATPVDLTALEFDLLRALVDHPGWVYSREQLLEQVWGYDYLGDSRVIDVHVANLRKKLGDDPADPRFIRTVRGVGYKFLQTAE